MVFTYITINEFLLGILTLEICAYKTFIATIHYDFMIANKVNLFDHLAAYYLVVYDVCKSLEVLGCLISNYP